MAAMGFLLHIKGMTSTMIMRRGVMRKGMMRKGTMRMGHGEDGT